VCLEPSEEGQQHYAVSQLAKAGSPVHRVLEEAIQQQQQQKKARVQPPYVPCITNYITTFLRNPDVVKAIHANATPFRWSMCSPRVSYSYKDVLSSVLPLYHKLLTSHRNLKIYIYSGDVDAIVPYWGTREWISKLAMPISNEWRAWLTSDKQVGGFVQEYAGGQFTFVTVRDAGHMVPQTQPMRAFHMFNAIINNKPL